MIPGPFTPVAEAAFSKERWCAPLLWHSELRNVFAVHVRAGKLSVEQARAQMKLAEKLFLNNEFSVRSDMVFDCVQNSSRSAYDCEFVALAKDLGLKLLTTDDGILADFSDVAVHLRDYGGRSF